ncbi:MAG: baseplate J/gp47 family protein [Opitutaceae bacterium]|jgi:uncharacterized phage protein gp47/JayE|nr:baseplate J/gp47 family protein [Opitutaceae bacterium]
MPNSIDYSGLKTKTLPEIIAGITDGAADAPGLRRIYNEDINLDSDTPDGRLVNIFALAVKDALDLLQQIYNSFDPDLAVGRALDQRCAINGITRHGGTHTQTVILVTTDRPVTLPGMDAATGTPFTVADGEGNKYLLKNTSPLAAAGVHELDFIAEDEGRVIALQNTITEQVTITLGVTGVLNPYPPYLTGVDEESDAALRARRARALALAGDSTVDALLAALHAVADIGQVVVFENTADTANPDGIPGHSIWVIAEGGTDDDVARAIYRRRPAGCGMKGETTVEVLMESGITMIVRFDRPENKDLYISFNATDSTGGGINEQELREKLAGKLSYGIFQIADITGITALARAINPEVVITAAGVSAAGVTYAPTATPPTRRGRWVVKSENILINGHDA